MKEVKEAKKLSYYEAGIARWELMNLDLSYVKKEFSLRELRLIVQENIVGLGDALRAIEVQQKELEAILADYNQELNDLNRKYSIGAKDITLTKEERFEYEGLAEDLKSKYKDAHIKFKAEDKEFTKMIADKECPFSLKKDIKKEMIPANINGRDMNILSRLMEW